MTAFRLLSLPTHSVLEMIVGFGLLVAPFALGFGPGGLIASVGLGVVLVGLAVGSADSLPLSAHMAFDYALVVALLAGALALSSVGDAMAALVWVSAGVFQLMLTLSTRYSRPPLQRLQA